MEQNKLTFSINESARILSVSRDSVLRAVKRGEIRTVKFGRRVLVPRVELERVVGERPAREGRDAR
jgi:excisionase family DNA binding protein